MIEKAIRVLQFLRVCDEQGQLSITTAAFVIAAVCLLSGKPISLTEFSAFSIALAGYHAKKYQTYARTQKAMQTAHEAGLAKLDAEKAVALQQKSEQASVLSDRV